MYVGIILLARFLMLILLRSLGKTQLVHQVGGNRFIPFFVNLHRRLAGTPGHVSGLHVMIGA